MKIFLVEMETISELATKPANGIVQIKMWLSTVFTIMCHGFLGLVITKEVMQDCGPMLKDFKAKLDEDQTIKAKIDNLRSDVENFALKFPMPGIDNW